MLLEEVVRRGNRIGVVDDK